MKNNFKVLIFLSFFFVLLSCKKEKEIEMPNIILIMTDDQGWGQTGYYDHPILKTPNLDAMAENGLRFDRFYAGAPQCSPTRASVLTGRNNDRTGVFYHGYPLNKYEITLAQKLKNIGYSTGHFGKWHLNGIRGPGVPIFGDDEYNPGVFGFDKWISTTNFFDIGINFILSFIIICPHELWSVQTMSSAVVVSESFVAAQLTGVMAHAVFTGAL